jgi:predicted ester cyclase
MATNNARLVRRVITEIWNEGALDLADHLFAPDYVNHGGLIPDLVRGPEAIKVSVAVYRAAFPAFQVDVIDLLAEGAVVAVRWVAQEQPSHAGVGTQPSGSQTAHTLCGMTFAHMRDDRIHESWTSWEPAGTGALEQSLSAWRNHQEAAAAHA